MSELNFQIGELLLVNKPLNWTSFDVVNKLRYEIKNQLGVKKIKVGHAGTLDPLADGLLIICTGKKTKEIDSFMGLPKTYSGTIRLGATTPSYDLETEIDQHFSLEKLSNEQIIDTAKGMIGFYEQYPPIFSAKKIKGQKAYDLARAGEDVQLDPKRIEIIDFQIKSIEMPIVHFEITCSKGTYIRSIAHDLGQKLNNGGHLTALKREKIGELSLHDAKEIDEWITVIRSSDPHKNRVNS